MYIQETIYDMLDNEKRESEQFTIFRKYMNVVGFVPLNQEHPRLEDFLVYLH